MGHGNEHPSGFNGRRHVEKGISFSASKLIRKEGGDLTVVLPAIISHDVGWKMVSENLQPEGFGSNMTRLDVRIFEVETGAL